MRKTKLNSEYSTFLKELQQAATGAATAASGAATAASMHQTEASGIKLVAACIKEGMWLEAHYLSSLLPLTAVTSLDYQRHLRTQRILAPLEAGGGGVPAHKKTLASFERLRSVTLRGGGVHASIVAIDRDSMYADVC